jgi:hypothetical protein
MSDAGKLTKDDVRNQRIQAIATALGSIRGSTTIAPSDTVPVLSGRQFAIVCSGAGNVKVTFVGGGTFTFPVATGLTIYDWAVSQVWTTGTTATAVYTNLN